MEDNAASSDDIENSPKDAPSSPIYNTAEHTSRLDELGLWASGSPDLGPASD